MRILQVVHGFPPYGSAGTELLTFYLSQVLGKRGHQVTVLTRIEDYEAEEFSVREEQMDGFNVVRVVNNHLRISAALRFSYDNSFCDAPFLRLLEQFQPAVVHFQHLVHLSVSLLPLAAALGYPTVLSFHDFFLPCHRLHLIDAHDRLCPGPDRGERCVACLQEFASAEEARRRFTYMEQALRAPDVILSPSAFLTEKMLGYFPFLRERLRTVPLGVKLIPARTRECQSETPLRILYLGFLFPPKGAHVLVEAVRGLPSNAFEVSLYGASSAFWQPYLDRLRAEAQGLPVHFYGPYPHEQIASILSRHDVLVVPGICEETFSIVTREALMAGLPVIAAHRGALPEIVQNEVNGLLFEPENANDLRRCLVQLLAEPDLLERLRAVDPPIKTMEAYAEELEGMYAEICAPPHRLGSLQKNLLERYQAHAALSHEHKQLHAETLELGAQKTILQSERDRLSVDKLRAEQERDQALATVQELRDTLDAREMEMRERDVLLTAIYASTTWKLYRCYTACVHFLIRRPLSKLKQWLVG